MASPRTRRRRWHPLGHEPHRRHPRGCPRQPTHPLRRDLGGHRERDVDTPGNLGVRISNRGLVWYTLTAWHDTAALDAFVTSERHRHAMRAVDQLTRNTAFARSGDRLRQCLGDRPRHRTGNDELVAVLGHERGDMRNARTAATPRTTSPAATAASASTSSRIASWSPSSSLYGSVLTPAGSVLVGEPVALGQLETSSTRLVDHHGRVRVELER